MLHVGDAPTLHRTEEEGLLRDNSDSERPELSNFGKDNQNHFISTVPESLGTTDLLTVRSHKENCFRIDSRTL